MKIQAFVVLCTATALLSMTALPTRAETPRQERREEFREHHPRRAEVNARIRNQRRLLKKDLKSGKITQDQYNAEMAKLKDAKQEEVQDVRKNGGSLTKNQTKDLNQDLNGTRKDINGMGGNTSSAQ